MVMTINKNPDVLITSKLQFQNNSRAPATRNIK